MNSTEVKQLKDDQLKAEIASTRDKLFRLRQQATTEKVENTGQFRLMKRDIARMLTEQTARSKGAAAPAKSSAKKPAASAAKPKAPAAKKPAKSKAAASK